MKAKELTKIIDEVKEITRDPLHLQIIIAKHKIIIESDAISTDAIQQIDELMGRKGKITSVNNYIHLAYPHQR